MRHDALPAQHVEPACRAWSEALRAAPSVRILSDPGATVAQARAARRIAYSLRSLLCFLLQAVGLMLDASGAIGRPIYMRFRALLENGRVKLINLEQVWGRGMPTCLFYSTVR